MKTGSAFSQIFQKNLLFRETFDSGAKMLFSVLLSLVVAFPLFAQSSGMTARQMVETIKQRIGVPWQEPTVDVFKAGNPDNIVTGVVTTMFPTMSVLQKAVSSGKNFIIVHEPAFYNHLDETSEFEKNNDPVYRDKIRYINEHNLIIWRFHDHWHLRKPDGILEGMTHALGWEDYRKEGAEGIFVIPPSTVQELKELVAEKLNASCTRIVGNPSMKITQVGFLPGAVGSELQMDFLRRNDVEVLLVGESREWETIEYVRDASLQGKKKALIVIGHIPSEEEGMKECARWIKSLFPHLDVSYVPSGEPFSKK